MLWPQKENSHIIERGKPCSFQKLHHSSRSEVVFRLVFRIRAYFRARKLNNFIRGCSIQRKLRKSISETRLFGIEVRRDNFETFKAYKVDASQL